MESEPICMSCGLCCDGSLFADVKLAGKDIELLSRTAVPDFAEGRVFQQKRLPQPCFGFKQGRCSIYESRPGHCRKFDCDLLLQLAAGKVSDRGARNTIARCRAKADQVRRLLRLMGSTDERMALAVRFRQVSRRAAELRHDKKHAAAFADLTVAMHELQSLLAEHIYPV